MSYKDELGAPGSQHQRQTETTTLQAEYLFLDGPNYQPQARINVRALHGAINRLYGANLDLHVLKDSIGRLMIFLIETDIRKQELQLEFVKDEISNISILLLFLSEITDRKVLDFEPPFTNAENHKI